MPPIRTNLPVGRVPPSIQTADPRIMTAHFIRQIEANHVRTPTQSRPVPLHFNWITQSLSEWSWPYNTEIQQRVPPSELESFRRTHRFRAPSCLCALLEGTKYTESRIAIVETVTGDSDRNQSILNGEYVAACAKKRCGFFIALERFFPLIHLRLQMCRRRESPLEPQELASIHDIDQSLRRGDGLFQLMTDVVVRGNGRRLEKIHPSLMDRVRDSLMNEILVGMSEERFWATFVQCIVCKNVTLRKNFALNHKCGAKRFRGLPYERANPETPSPAPIGLRGTSTSLSSPTPTETLEFGCDEGYDVFGDLEFLGVLVGDEPEEAPTSSISFPRSASTTTEGEDPGSVSGSDGYLADDDDQVLVDTESEGVPSELDDSYELPSWTEISNTA